MGLLPEIREVHSYRTPNCMQSHGSPVWQGRSFRMENITNFTAIACLFGFWLHSESIGRRINQGKVLQGLSLYCRVSKYSNTGLYQMKREQFFLKDAWKGQNRKQHPCGWQVNGIIGGVCVWWQPWEWAPCDKPPSRESMPFLPDCKLLKLDFPFAEKSMFLTRFYKKHIQGQY